MPGVDRDSFDGTLVQSELTNPCGFEYSCTQVSLIADASDGFVVATGSDLGRDPFTDEDLSDIFVTFASVVAQFAGEDAATIRTAVMSALSGSWTAAGDVMPSPFDQKVTKPTRMVFHVHSPGWGFEEARIKFKSSFPPGAFCGLQWLTLDGVSKQPYSFQLLAQATPAVKGVYDFALFIRVSQEAGLQSTRLIIDPQVDIDP